ncbi:MAG: hypothetical protein AAF734_11880 [Bacteroidota bacterium]
MGKRTHIEDYQKVQKADDLNDLVKDKRAAKRANKQKKNRRARHYVKTLLRHLTDDQD